MRIGDRTLSWGERLGYALMAACLIAAAYLIDGSIR